MKNVKDSGINYCGSIPAHWKVMPNKYIFNLSKKIVDNPDNWQLLSLTTKGIKTKSDGDTTGKVPENYNGYQIVQPDDLVMCLFDLDVSAVFAGRSTISGMISPAYKVYKTKKDIADTHYMDYWFSYVFSGRHYKQFSKSLRYTVNTDEFGQLLTILPPLSEQIAIVKFLDSSCEKIERIISDIQKQIIILKNYRNSIITETVTKGVADNNKLYEIDMGWITRIPSHWKVSRIGSLYKLRNTKVSDKDYPPLSVTMQGILPQLETAAKTNAHDDRKLVCKGDFAINSRSDRRGSCGISPYDGSISLINTVLCPLENMNPDYYNWLFHTEAFADEFYKWGHGIVDDLWTTGWQEMKNILIPVPPLNEQEQIAAYLNKKCFDIDSIINDKRREIDVLEDYKKSLIFEYVTGKKEVPNE